MDDAVEAAIRTVHALILKHYRNLHDVKLEASGHLGIEGCPDLCVEIHVTGSNEQILEDEAEFYTAFFERVPERFQRFFTFTYHIPEDSSCHTCSVQHVNEK